MAAQNDEALANVARLEGENNVCIVLERLHISKTDLFFLLQELRSQKDEAVADLERVENNNNVRLD